MIKFMKLLEDKKKIIAIYPGESEKHPYMYYYEDPKTKEIFYISGNGHNPVIVADDADEFNKLVKNNRIQAQLMKEGTYSEMSLSDIAWEIDNDWKTVNYAAKPYLQAMYSLESITDKYGMDSGKSIVAYFLSNASQWKGPLAKEIKVELKKRLKRGR